MDIDSEQLGIPETDYDAKISMPSAEFAKIMRDLKDLGESVKIEATTEGVKFTAEGEIGTGSVTVKPTSSSGKSKKSGGAKPKVKAKKEESDDEDMDEDEDVKPVIKDESEEEDEDDEDEEEEEEEDEAPKGKKGKKTGSKSSKGKPSKAKGKSKGDEEESREVTVDVSQSVSLNFSIKYLNNFAKSTPLSTTVNLQMSNDVPLLVEYTWEGGSIKFYLAPKSMCNVRWAYMTLILIPAHLAVAED